MNAPKLYTREIPFGPANLPVASLFNDPIQEWLGRALAARKEEWADQGLGSVTVIGVRLR